ncbi:MAG TPA: lasso RiPP family leader peptide-containing protein [Tepidisphaeraceae bacterium]|nr:lasso RiPP family leader peptide-containing protein [Tepidisphaeraceae bacterium]
MKKRYVRPQLIVHGTVEVVTLGCDPLSRPI